MLPIVLGLLLAFNVSYAQDKAVSGRVTADEDGSALPGVSVVLKGTTSGTVTDIDGNFKVNVPDGTTLIFSFIGFSTQEVLVGNQEIVNIVMLGDVTQLSEVVVTGYSTTTQKKLLSSVSVIDEKDIQNVPLTDINQIMQGRAPGVRVTAPSGQPGAQQNIRIRGTGSITAGRGPIYVLDGIIISNGDFTTSTQTADVLSNINPGDIENITVLKDASATALYGARASNGVVLITTKKGSVGKTKITAKLQYGTTEPLIGNFEMMTAQQQWDYERQLMVNSGFDQPTIDATRPASMLDNTTDWVDAAFKTGSTSNFELQASGGNEKTRFFMSGGSYFQDGTLIESDFRRYTARLNLDHDATDLITVGVNFNVSYTDQLNATAGNRFASPLLGAFVNTPTQSAINPATGELYTGQEPEFAIFTSDNFLYSAPRNPVRNNTLRTLGKAYITLNLTDNIRVTQNLNIDFIGITENVFQDPTTNDGAADNGQIGNDYNQAITFTSQTLVNFEKQIGEDHSIDGVAGFEYQKNERDNFVAGGKGLATGQLKTINSTATADATDVAGFQTAYAFISYLVNANYNYKEKYFFGASFRYDGSSRFGEDNQWAPFWSVAGSWRFADEDFMSNMTWLTDGKLRVSYGTSGNADIGNYASLGTYGYGAAYNGIPGSQPNQISNPALSWEKSNSINIGLDLGFIQNRLTASFDFYKRQSTDLLLNVPLSRTTGFASSLQNVGSMENTGLEMLISAVIIDKAFNWTLDFNAAWNTNKIVTLPKGEDILNGSQIYREGEPVRSWYVQEWAGVNTADGTPLWNEGGFDTDGNFTGEGLTTTGVYGQADRYLVGNAEPKYSGGLNNTFSYKGISLGLFTTFVQGNLVYNSSRRFIESDGQRFGWNHLVSNGEDTWQNPGDVASRPQGLVGGNNSANSRSTRYFEDGSFFRLRNVTLGYSIPRSVLGNSGFSAVNVYVTGQNLWIATEYTGFDPEMAENGQEFFRYPVGRSFTVGLDLTF